MLPQMELASLIRVNNINGCRLCGPNFSIISKKLALTNHQILFISDGEDFSLPYKAIDGVRLLDTVAERRYPQSGLSGHTLSIQTKTFCIYEVTILNGNEARALLLSLEALANVDVGLQYPFFCKATIPNSQHTLTAVDGRSDLAESVATKKWRVSNVNETYSVCQTYARETIVPSDVTDTIIRESAGFRRGGRFPLLVYYHLPRQTALLIASEPFVQSSTYAAVGLTSNAARTPSGLGSPQHAPIAGGSAFSPNASSTSVGSVAGSRCRADEQLLAAILPDRYRGAILDLRDQVHIRKASQTGIAESEPYYPQWRRISRSLEAPSQVNVAFQKLIEVCIAPGRSTRAGTGSLTAFTTGALADSLNALATVAMGPSGGSTINSDSSNGENTSRIIWDVDGESIDRTSSSLPAEVSSTTMSSNPQLAHNTRRIGAWLTLVREALAAAVAGATALDARDAFAQQQLQQEQLILARKYKDQQTKLALTSRTNPVREEAKLRGSFVLVQSRHGYDRALVVAGLIQVMLNPSARTLSGFCELIEHTWIQAGHPFSERYRNAALGSRTQKTQAPMFLLFLDGVWQLWRQYPNGFEFTDELLCLLAQHVYYSEFGTFLGNSPKEREELMITERTASLWAYLVQPSVRANFTNPLYCADEDRDTTNYACWPCLAPQALELWRELYLKQQYTEPEPLWNKPRQLNRVIKEQFFTELERTRHLRKLLTSLQQEACAAGLLKEASVN